MKQLLIVLLVVIASCTNRQGETQQENKMANHRHDTLATAQPKSSARWKADEVTKQNVAAMGQVMNDTTYSDASKRRQLYTSMKSKTDTLITQCRMKGAEHEALHVWLGKVLKDLKELKEDDDEYSEAHAALKKDVESFYDTFE